MVRSQGWSYPLEVKLCIPKVWRPCVCPYVLLNNWEYSPLGVNKRVNVPLHRWQSSPLGSMFTHREQLLSKVKTHIVKNRPLLPQRCSRSKDGIHHSEKSRFANKNLINTLSKSFNISFALMNSVNRLGEIWQFLKKWSHTYLNNDYFSYNSVKWSIILKSKFL
jgi:hypothetical protein